MEFSNWMVCALQRGLSTLGLREGLDSQASSSEGISSNKLCILDANDEESEHMLFGQVSNLQYRKDVSKCHWDDEMQLAEVLERKGQMWITTGIVRNSKLYCTIEETLFLAELGALIVLDNDGVRLPLEYAHRKLAEGKNGCCSEAFQVYRHLKSLGYIVGRHGVPWTLKKTTGKFTYLESTPKSIEVGDVESMDTSSTLNSFNTIHIDKATPLFDVFRPNSKFKKSDPGKAMFVACLTRGNPPSIEEVEILERLCGSIPLKFFHVEHGPGRVSYFSYNQVELPVLP